MDIHDAHKDLIAPFRASLASCDAGQVRSAITELFAPQAAIRLHAPHGILIGPEALWSEVYAPLFDALPGFERRDFIVMAGPRWGVAEPGHWIGLGGHILGTFAKPYLGIPPTGQPVHIRYHEYLRIVDGKVVEMQALWDLGQLMEQAGVWPMGPQAGIDWMSPGPGNGYVHLSQNHDDRRSDQSVQRVWDMLHEVQTGTSNRPEAGLGGYWHPQAWWHGPTGLGTARGHRDIAQKIFKQFRDGLSQNTRHLKEGVFFGDGDLVAFTGWPSGTAVHSGEGFLGLRPTGNTVTRCSLDFWRLENGLIRDCWVMVDMIDLYRQLGVDVFDRMRAMAQERAA